MDQNFQRIDEILRRLKIEPRASGLGIGREWQPTTGNTLIARSPIDGRTLGEIRCVTASEVESAIGAAHDAYTIFRSIPAPRRGEFVRRVGDRLRQRKQELAAVVSWEAGKITAEALGEVQEMIDVCDFAVGLSRQLYGLTIASERPGHRMMEQWLPLGPIGVITAFNFPVAVWAWNAMIAWVCGDPVVWKPSEKTPLCAIACQNIVSDVLAEMTEIPPAISCVVIGDAQNAGVPLAVSPALPLISATGSTRMGRAVGEIVGKRLGRSLLELGGNNAMVLAPSADLDLATRAVVFAAAGTAGQRCTTLRRLIAHRSIQPEIVRRLATIYTRLKIGNPLEPGVLVGPLIDGAAYEGMQHALREAKQQGGHIVVGGQRVTEGVPKDAFYVQPTIVEIGADAPIVREETFAPILYVISYDTLDEAIAHHNNVPQGLSSAIFTSDLREAEVFLSASGSDCGIVNVNIGTSGAEIGGAFGGEKATGGGRESGSDSWKAYMRRVTNTINYSGDLPLAQGISFDVGP